MLKLTYIDNGFCLEHLTQSLEEWVALRAILALRVGDRLLIEPSTASFLLPTDLPGLDTLAEAQHQTDNEITLCGCDAEYLEVCLEGIWLASSTETEQGIFVTTLSYTIEFLLFKLWQESQMNTTVVGD